MMNVIVNGEPRDLDFGTTVAALVQSLGIAPPHVAVELNLEVIPRVRHGETVLHEGDRLEIVTLVGGG
jgi:sulfur carrier protein